MKKSTRKFLVNLLITIAILLLVILLLKKPQAQTTEEIARCIGKNSVLYTQLGCHACETQEEMFGENYQYLNIVDCFFEQDKCGEIMATPTWKIKGNLYRGVQSIQTLQELTGC